MTSEAIDKGTGRPLEEWYGVIRDAGKGVASHKEIADFLHEVHEVSYWWAQEITVEYERFIGRRVHGQTQDGKFQIGVSRTIHAPVADVWTLVEAVASEPPVAGSGIFSTVTTHVPGSHLRMQWRLHDWEEHSILQIRVTPRGPGKTTVTFHHEKLPDAAARQQMKERWQGVAALIVDRA